MMSLLLNETTVFYHNYCLRVFDKSGPALIKNWAAGVTATSTNSKSGSVSLTPQSKKLAVSAKGKTAVKGVLVELSDIEWLAGKEDDSKPPAKRARPSAVGFP